MRSDEDEPTSADAGGEAAAAVGPGTGADEPADTPVEELVPDRPDEARTPMRSPLALLWTAVVGAAMGVAELVPGFSGGTVALVGGIYERLVATIRQGARVLSLLVRGRLTDALRALAAIEWWFAGFLGVGMAVTLLSLAATVEALIAERPVELAATFLGLMLAATALAARRFREPRGWHLPIIVAAAAVAFVVLGRTPGTIAEPSLLLVLIGGAIAVCAWILPGVSGSFLLLVLGLYPAIIAAIAARDVSVLAVLAVGMTVGLAGFSTALNWLLARAHDVVLAVLLGVMLGSARVLWPWPSEQALVTAELGPPEPETAFLAAALAFGAFGLLSLLGLVASGMERSWRSWQARRAAAGRAPLPGWLTGR